MSAPPLCVCGCAWRMHALAARRGGCPNHPQCVAYQASGAAGNLGEGDAAPDPTITRGGDGDVTQVETGPAIRAAGHKGPEGTAGSTAGPTLDPDNADTLRVLADLNARRAQDPRCRQDADVYRRRAVACLAGAEAIEQTATAGEPQ